MLKVSLSFIAISIMFTISAVSTFIKEYIFSSNAKIAS